MYNASVCIDCRSDYYKTKEPSPNLLLGREKGTNHLDGIPKSKESNEKRSVSNKKFCKENPDSVKARGVKTRGINHYRWNGGITKLNKSIRGLIENRRWSEAVRARDGRCVSCGVTDMLEADHIVPLAQLLVQHNITNTNEARTCNELWDIANGMTLCRSCHCEKDGRK